MSTSKIIISVLGTGCILIISFCSINTLHAQTKLRIGTFDSRVIAVAYANSKFNTMSSELGVKMQAAKEKNDANEIAQIEREGKMRQAMMHEQGFGTGSVRNILNLMKDKVAEMAKKEKLNLIVSKWEVVYNSTNCELVDVTEKIVNFFEPNEKMKMMMKEMMKQEPMKDAYLIED